MCIRDRYEVLNRIKGAYAMGILCSDFPEQLIAVRKDAPLLIGLSLIHI